jgi:hypothetical protein
VRITRAAHPLVQSLFRVLSFRSECLRDLGLGRSANLLWRQVGNLLGQSAAEDVSVT